MNNGKVLIVDDEEEIVEQFARMLKGQGYGVEPAYSGEEAWEKFQKQYFDVVLADWKMGRMNGLELLKRIDESVPHSQVIMITAFGDEESALEAHHRHAFDFLKKPVERQRLLDAVDKAMARRDPVIRVLEDWVENNPEEADEKTTVKLADPGNAWSVRDTLEAIRRNTPWGRAQYEDIIDLTIYLMARGEIDARTLEAMCRRRDTR